MTKEQSAVEIISRFSNTTLSSLKTPMTQEEKLIRARQAAAWVFTSPGAKTSIFAGNWDTGNVVQSALYALDHLDEPIVDPDLIEARKLWAEQCPHVAEEYLAGKYDKCESTLRTLAAIKLGRALERGNG